METSSPDFDPRAVHVPVLLREVLQQMRLEPGLIVVDGTVGAGGHSREMLKRIGTHGRLIGLDRDPMMLEHAAKAVSGDRVVLKCASYVDLPQVLRELGIDKVDRILLDLGLSSDQLADASRGFGFGSDGPLDLRFDKSSGRPAWQILAQESVARIEEILREFGEEPHARPLAEYLVSRRAVQPIRTGADLANAVAGCPAMRRGAAKDKNPATRVFQALRIAANDELDHVQRGITSSAFESLKPGGLLGVISFHSLEDRLVKNEFQNHERWQPITAKPIVATPQEQRFNPRSRSAKFRVAQKEGTLK